MSKVAIVCEHLMERDDQGYLDCLDALCEVHEDSEIFTLAHSPGKILGAPEQRRISSTFLSTMAEKRPLGRLRYLFPQALKTLVIPSGVQKVIILSRGLAHRVALPGGAQVSVYFFDQETLAPSKGLMNKVFASYLRHESLMAVKALMGRERTRLMASSYHLKNQLGQTTNADLKVVYPFIKAGEYPLRNPAMPRPDFLPTAPYIVVGSTGLNPQKLRQVRGWYPRHTLVVAGEYQQTDQVENAQFWGRRCGGDMSLLLMFADAVVDSTQAHHAYPKLALEALATGAKVVLEKNPLTQEYFKHGKNTFFDPTTAQGGEGASQETRNQVLKFNELTFKSALR